MSDLKRSCLVLLLAGISCDDIDAAPLSIRDLNPLLVGFELPPALPASLDSNIAIDASYAISNITLDQSTTNEQAFADAETRRWTLSATKQFNDRWLVNLELPYVSVSSGSLDGFIEHFHSTFNLPNGNRAQWPRNRLLIDYRAGDQSIFYLNHNVAGLGDSTVRAARLINRSTSHPIAVWFSLKLPTGNAKSLTGSGSVDTAISISAQQQLDAFQFFEQLSLSWLGNATRLSSMQKHAAWSGLAGFSWALTGTIDFVAQVQSLSAAYNSDLRMLGAATQLSIGPQWHTSHWLASFSITEDVVIDSAPDVQFQFNLMRKF